MGTKNVAFLLVVASFLVGLAGYEPGARPGRIQTLSLVLSIGAIVATAAI